MSILVLSRPDDHAATGPVLAALRHRGERPVFIDTTQVPQRGGLSWRGPGDGWLEVPGHGPIALTDVRYVWARRTAWAAELLKRQDLHSDVSRAARGESAHVVEAALLDTNALWVDPPAVYARARNKALQLAVAEQVGLRTPLTLETNDPVEARAFVAAIDGPVISKMFTDVRVEDGTIYTNILSADDVAALDGIRPCPTILQQAIPKDHELRVVVVGMQVFAAALDTPSLHGAEVDWRRTGAATIDRWRAVELSATESDRFLALHDALGTNYGSADCVRTPDGELVLLENNVVGESFWLYDLHPLAEAWADLLTGAMPARTAPPHLR